MNRPPDPRPGTNLGDAYDRAVCDLDGRPGVTKTQPSTIRVNSALTTTTETYIVQTYRDEERGDTILVERGSAERMTRMVLPPKVAEAVARQREALTTKSRKAGAQKAARTREERGIKPAFLKKGGRS